ncbi:hypothetical protein [Vibrio superstes]|uniref:Uncharacterized protein n=1 Tax=Vibrio superstes NBRC 103154 TaxID=1219062 RepID=A0A511QUZ0_9VIBR|nr:hypothetical protein [Vibrio superstes]GEM81183.1 hypothetical protein VSU01S_34280 [Vibrio superstes NBRC 103154]
MSKLLIGIVLGSYLIGFTSSAADEKVQRAESAAHSDLSSKATILDTDGSVLREGSPHWHCVPGIPVVPGDIHPMCNDAVWSKLLEAAATGQPFETDRIGISYMMQGDAYVSNSNPAATDPDNGDVWVKEGPHLMIVVPKELLKGVSDDPFNGGPYVMWKDTPYAHIMVPIKNK